MHSSAPRPSNDRLNSFRVPLQTTAQAIIIACDTHYDFLKVVCCKAHSIVSATGWKSHQITFHPHQCIGFPMETGTVITIPATYHLSTPTYSTCQDDTFKAPASSLRSRNSNSAARCVIQATTRLYTSNYGFPLLPASEGRAVWRADETR